MANVLTALARLFRRREPGEATPSQGAVGITIRERDKMLSGQDLYREVKTANEADDTADFKAFRERLDKMMPG